MRHLILSAIILLSPAVILLTACNPLQYMTVNSTQLTHNDYNQLVYENDTMRLIYDIGGNDGAATLRILKKTGQPLTVNWRKSAFIRNQQSIGFYGQDIIVHGHTISHSRYNRDFIASFLLPDSVDFIPPGSGIARNLPTLASTGPLQIDLLDSRPEAFTLYHGRGDQIYIRSKMSSPAVGEGQPTASSNIR